MTPIPLKGPDPRPRPPPEQHPGRSQDFDGAGRVVSKGSFLQVDSQNPHCYDANDVQLQQWLMLSIVVAGKQARQQQAKLQAFLHKFARDTLMPTNHRFTPLRLLALVGPETIEQDLRCVKMGQYTRIAKAFHELAQRIEVKKTLDLRTCTAADLEAVPGIGPKTARFFLLYTRRGYRAAVLDTHILAWMRENRGRLKLSRRMKIPKTTPNGQRYLALETAFLDYCDEHQLNPADFDFSIWKRRNKGDQRAAAA